MSRATWFLILALATPAAAQDTPQRHVTAVVTLTNGTIGVYSIDSGGARRVVVDAAAKTVDTLLGHPRGGRWTAPAAQVVDHVAALLAALDALAAGQPAPDVTLGYASGPVRTAVIRCTATTGCTLTVTNRTPAGATRAGSWTTSPRIPLATMRRLALALRTAALHDTDAVLVVP